MLLRAARRQSQGCRRGFKVGPAEILVEYAPGAGSCDLPSGSRFVQRRRGMNRYSTTAAVCATAVLGLALLAPRCQAQKDNIPIYMGDPPAQAGITVTGWGSGVALPDKATTFTGSD